MNFDRGCDSGKSRYCLVQAWMFDLLEVEGVALGGSFEGDLEHPVCAGDEADLQELVVVAGLHCPAPHRGTALSAARNADVWRGRAQENSCKLKVKWRP